MLTCLQLPGRSAMALWLTCPISRLGYVLDTLAENELSEEKTRLLGQQRGSFGHLPSENFVSRTFEISCSTRLSQTTNAKRATMRPKIYSRLKQSEDDSLTTKLEYDGPRRVNGYTCAQKLTYVFLSVLAAVSCGLFGYVVARTNIRATSVAVKVSTPPSELLCGNSSTEARALGCVFDLLTNNWMPQYCSDPTTDAEYRAWVLDPSRSLGAWAFYHDDKAEHQVASEEELSDLVGSHIYTTTENHLAHCAFLARRMHRLVTGDIAAVAHNTFAHTMHCSSAILKAIGTTEQHVTTGIGSTFDVGIVPCLVE
jgi:hypothetical protein